MTMGDGEDERNHALRNAINAAIMAAQVVRRHLELGNYPKALDFLDGVDESCERCRVLIEQIEPGSSPL